MQSQDYFNQDATGLAGLIKTGQVSALEALDNAISQIEKLNPVYNAVVECCYDQARADIAAMNRSAPFAGVPYLIKDLHTHVAGTHLTQGCRFFRGNLSHRDSDLVQRLRRAGFIIVGRTNSPEFGLNITTEPVLFGATRNPWDIARSPGGSSGGSAAAVLAGMVPAAHATDSGGSIRIPASCCGLVGMKPSRGRIFAGLDYGEGWHDMFTAHAITKSVRDSAAILLATCNRFDPAPYRCPNALPEEIEQLLTPPRHLRIGVLAKPPSGVPVSDTCIEALNEAGQLCLAMGHSLEPLEISYETAAYGQAFTLILSAKVAAAVDLYEIETGTKATASDFENAVWHCVEMGRNASAAELNRATALIHLTAQEICRQTAHVDVVMSPTLSRPLIPLGELIPEGDDISEFLARVFEFAPFTSMFNATGQPAVSLPLGWSPEGLPVGIQFAAPYGREDLLFGLAAAFEQSVPWQKRYQPLWEKMQADLTGRCLK